MISQLKSGSLTVHAENVDIDELIIKAFNHFHSFLSSRSLKPVINFSANIVNYSILVDKDKLWIVFFKSDRKCNKIQPSENNYKL